MTFGLLNPRHAARLPLLALSLALAAGPLCAASKKKPQQPSAAPVRATRQPSYSIPVDQLGFGAPGELYLGSRVSLASLDFLDEDHILFTFRIPGLMHRDTQQKESAGNERRIRAVVLRLPQGTVEAEAIWTLHDRSRYLYNLDHGQFLLRDGDTLSIGDASLQLKPYLHFPGNLLWVELDPSRHYFVTGSSEPARQSSSAASAGRVGSPMTAAAASLTSQTSSGDTPAPPQENTILRILRRSDGAVMLVSRVRNSVHVPLNDDGFLESLPANNHRWELSFHAFTGESSVVNRVDSHCAPLVDFLSQSTFLATACDETGQPKLVALTTDGRRLWENPSVGPSVWPVLAFSQTGARFARETLMANHEVNARAPLGVEDIRGQDVQIIDSATGNVVLRAAASPILDAGGNAAISPSERRIAILMAGSLQIFDLPPPPPLPSTAHKGK